MSNSKTISINPALFALSSGNRSRKQRASGGATTVPKPKPVISSNGLKNELLKRIRQHKQQQQQHLQSAARLMPKRPSVATVATPLEEAATTEDEFASSMQYLEAVDAERRVGDHSEKKQYERSKQRKREELLRQTVRQRHLVQASSSAPPVFLDLPDELQDTHPGPAIIGNNIQITTGTVVPTAAAYHVDSKVPYGVLKGGVKPTYRDWNRTQRVHPLVQQMQLRQEKQQARVLSHSGSSTHREQRLQQLKSKIKLKQARVLQQKTTSGVQTDLLSSTSMENDAAEPEREETEKPENPEESKLLSPTPPVASSVPKRVVKRTVKRKFTLGKSKVKRTVGVLLKDRGTRKHIIAAHKDLKKKPMAEVKQYLKDHNLIKVGSGAPNDVLRKMYESAVLSGEVLNENTDTMLHNLAASTD